MDAVSCLNQYYLYSFMTQSPNIITHVSFISVKDKRADLLSSTQVD